MVWDNLLVNIQVCIGGIAGSIGGGISVGIGGVGITTCRSGLMTEEAAPA